MREHKFILNGKIPETCSDLLKWAQWFETAERHVARTELGEILVSTIFLGLDHGFSDTDPPILFETIAFGEPHQQLLFGIPRLVRDNICCARYTYWEQAAAGHAEIVTRVRMLQDKSQDATDEILVKLRTR